MECVFISRPLKGIIDYFLILTDKKVFRSPAFKIWNGVDVAEAKIIRY